MGCDQSSPLPGAGPHAFVLRLWVEPREVADAPPRVRAWVQHLASGEDSNVADLAELVRFVASRVPNGAEAVIRWAQA